VSAFDVGHIITAFNSDARLGDTRGRCVYWIPEHFVLDSGFSGADADRTARQARLELAHLGDLHFSETTFNYLLLVSV